MALPLDKPTICPVLIGRARELAALHSLMDVAMSGQGHAALICGEAGIGKSRLVAEAKTTALAQGFLLLQGNCFQSDSSSPYAPLLDLLRAFFASRLPAPLAADQEPLVRELARLLPDLSLLFPPLVPIPLPHTFEVDPFSWSAQLWKLSKEKSVKTLKKTFMRSVNR